MKRPPDIPLTIRAACNVCPSEDPAKVVKAVGNVLNNCVPELIDDKVQVFSKDPRSLNMIYEQARSRAILGVLRRVLEYNMVANSTWFFLNKQAAYAGIISVCEEESESPLGPIRITITSNQLQSVIEWLIT